MSKKVSLKQFLMKSGRFVRVDDCVKAIREGKVSFNGKIILNPNYYFPLRNALVKYDNEKIKAIPKLYLLLNKQAGFLSQKSEGEKTIYDLLKYLNLPKDSVQSLSAVGRLDKDTEGLMIITNDGKLSNLIMNPENNIIKKYYAVLEKPVDINKIKILEKGIDIGIEFEKYKTKPCKIKITGGKEVYISISEGKKRQIRKMIEAIGNNVIYLKRVSIGGLQLGNLKVGEIKSITREEIVEKLELIQHQ